MGGLRMFVEAEKLGQIAFVLPCAVIIGWLMGLWAGSKLHIGWLQIVGILLGCVSGIVYVVRMAIAAEKDAARADAKAEEDAKAEKAEKSRELTGKGMNTFK
jgi:F0F1-type ATP synthase assembly protein I